MDVTKIPAKLPDSIKRKKVAAYTRVSTSSDTQLHSLEAQIDYYRTNINSHAAWTFVGVFVDNSLTGTRRDRPGLDNLLASCRNGEVDLILTKSISRFARNTVDLLNIIRELKELSVAVYFEREQINTLTAEGELMLTLLASFAQEESRSMSLNKSWRVQQQFANGELVGMVHLYGYKVVNGKLQINEHEAKIVRMIYKDYLGGMQSSEIAKKLNQMKEPRKRGGQWKAHDISNLLRNEKHTGNALLNKRYVVDPISKKDVYNRGERPRYYVENSHEGIISQELYEAMRAEMKRRTPNKEVVKKHNKPFTGLVSCGACGAKFQRKKTPVRVFWRCGRNLGSYEGHCSMKGIPEETLEAICCEILNLKDFVSDAFKANVEKIIITRANELTFYLKNGREITKTWKDRSRSKSWTPEMRDKVGQKNRERAKHDD